MSEHDVLFGFPLRCSRWPRSSARSRAPAERWASTARPITGSSGGSIAGGSRRLGFASAGGRGCRTRSAPSRVARDRLRAGPPGPGPKAHLRRAPKGEMGRDRISEHGVWRVRPGRAEHALEAPRARRPPPRPYERRPPVRPPERHIEAHEPGEKVQLDCFYVGRLSGTKGTVWQYTAIDVASAFAWAELRTSERNPRGPPHPRAAPPVARELKAAGGSSGRSAPTTAPSSAPSTSATRSRRSGPANASSRRVGPTRTAASSASS
jgi:hypothetical protein